MKPFKGKSPSFWNQLNGEEYITIRLIENPIIEKETTFRDSRFISGTLFCICIAALAGLTIKINQSPNLVTGNVLLISAIYLVYGIGMFTTLRSFITKEISLKLTPRYIEFRNLKIQWEDISNMYVIAQNNGDSQFYELIIEAKGKEYNCGIQGWLKESPKEVIHSIEKYYSSWFHAFGTK